MSEDTKVVLGLFGGLVGVVFLVVEIGITVFHWRAMWAFLQEPWQWQQWYIMAMIWGAMGWDRYRVAAKILDAEGLE